MAQEMLSTRALVQISGADARGWLQGLLTNDVLAVRQEQPLYAGFLSPQGKLIAEILLFDDGEGGLLLDVDRAAAPTLLKRLTLYKLRAAVTIRPRDDLAVWVDRDGQSCGRPRDPRLPALGQRWVGESGSGPAAGDDYRRHRWAMGVAEGVVETGNGQLLWLETNAEELNGVSYTKGCYVGQENTARMHHRAKVRKRILPVTADGELPAQGVLMVGDRAAGELLVSAAHHGLAVVRLDNLGEALSIEGRSVAVSPPAWLAGILSFSAPNDQPDLAS